MEEKIILETYQKELNEIEENLKSINHTLNELEIEKNKISKYEYDSKWKIEENQAVNYRNRLLERKETLERITKAYDMLKIYQESLENLEKIKVSSLQEKNELENDRKRLQNLIEQNMTILPQELQNAISKNTINAKNNKENSNKNLPEEPNLVEKSPEKIEDYQNEIVVSQNELKHLAEEIQMLESEKDTISREEYIKNLHFLESCIRKEKRKLLKNTQIINCYEIVLNNLEKMQEIDTTIARDEQESKEMSRDRIILQNEIDRNKKFLPESLINNLDNQIIQSQNIDYFNENTPIINANNDNNNEIEGIPTQDSTMSYENLKNLSSEDLQMRYNQLTKILEDYKDETEKNLPEDFAEVANEAEAIADLLVSRGVPLPLQDNFEKNNISEEVEPEVEPSEPVMKPITSFSKDLNDALNTTIANLSTNDKQSVNKNVSTTDEDLIRQFNELFQSNLRNLERQQQQEADKIHKEDLKKTESIKKESKSSSEISDISPTTDDLDSSKEKNKKDTQDKKTKKKKEVTSVRKPKKNIFRRLITKISSVAVNLVLICAERTAIFKKNTNPNPNAAESNDENSEINLAGTQSSLDKNDVLNDYSTSNEEFLINDSDDNIGLSEYDDTNLYTENDSSNLTYLDDDVETYTSYEANEYNNLNENSIRIGSEVTVDGNIHDDEYDAYYNENGQTLYYGTKPKRVVIGTGIVNNDGMNVIYAYNPDANQKIDELLNKGGEMVSILTANKEKYLQNYDGSTTLTPEEIKAYAEGWYNINDVSINNVKGLSR